MVLKKRGNFQFISFLLCVCMCFGLFAGFSGQGLALEAIEGNSDITMKDMTGHWAVEQVHTWLHKGLIQGYPDRTFRPNDPVTRAEFMAMVNRAYGFTKGAAMNFSDVPSHAWYYEEIGKGVLAGYIMGYDDGTVKPEQSISRQEAAVILARLLQLNSDGSGEAAALYADFHQTASWSKWAVDAVLQAEYMGGYPNGTFAPLKNITRAESIVTLSRATGKIYNTAGTYNEMGTNYGNATINTSGVILDGAVVEGNLYLTPGIGEGTVVLRNVTVKGTTVIAGGGRNSVLIEDCELNKVIAAREDGIVRISAQGSTSIQIVVVEAGSIVDTGGVSGPGGIQTVYITTEDVVELIGNFESVFIENQNAVLNIVEGSIERLVISEAAAGSSVNISENAAVTKMEVHASIVVTGKGTIENAVISEGAEETTFENEPVTKEGPGLTEPSTPVAGSTGGGGGSSGGGTGGGTTVRTVNLSTISGVTVPVKGEIPATAIMETAQYTGTIAWSPAHAVFDADTLYTATITLTAKSGYTLNGVLANFFTVAGADTVSNSANSGTVTAVFPATAAPGQPTTYNLTLTGDNISSDPATGAIDENTEITITVSPPIGKQVATFTVGGTDKKSELLAAPTHQYVFSITENITVAVTYEDIPSGNTPPALNADTTQNYAGQTLMITFSDRQAWANAITEVIVGGETLSMQPENIQYYLNTGDDVVDGHISLYGSKINALLTPGSKEIRVKSTGYADAVVMQDITATSFDRAEFTTQPVGPVENGGVLTTQPVIALFDKYNNPCTNGPSSTIEIILQEKTGSGWTLGGTSTANAVDGVVTFTGLTATNPSGLAITDAQLMYEVIGTPNQYFYSESFTIPGATGLAAPSLTADTTDNYAGNNIAITLPVGDWADWLIAISAIKVDGVSLTTQQYNIGINDLRLITDEISIMQTPGTYIITVEASGYNNAVVSQVVTAGFVNSAQFTTQPQGPLVSGGQLLQQPVVTLYDKYDNVCASGPSGSLSVSLTRELENSWTLGGTIMVTAVNGVATFTDLTATNSSDASISDARISYAFTGLPSFTIYSDYFTIPALGSQAAPTLTPDTTDNYAGNTIEITFVDDPIWRAAVDSIILGVEGGTNVQLFEAEGVTLEPGRIILETAKIPGLQKRNIGHLISIAATNYEPTITYQKIYAGLAASITVETEPIGPASNGANFHSAPAIALYDAYNNQCIDGPSAAVAVNVEKIDGGDWLLGSIISNTTYQGSVTFGGLSAYNLTGSEITDAKLRFTVDGTAVMADSTPFIIPAGAAGGAAPIFTPETQNNYIGYDGGNFNMTYPQNDDWTTQVINVGKLYLDGVELIKFTDYNLSIGNDQHYLIIDEPQKYFTEVRDYIIRIEAAGYADAVIVQPITNGAPNYLVIDTQPGSPSESGELLNPQPVIKVYDKDGNLCTVMRGVFPGGASPQIMADRHENDALSLWYLAGTTTVDMVDGIAVFTGLNAVSHTPDVTTEGMQVRFQLQLSGIDAVSEAFIIPPRTYSLTLEANPPDGGTALIDSDSNSSGSFNAGAQVVVTATAGQDYAFVNWMANGTEVSDQPSFTYTMPASDTVLMAQFTSTLPQAAPDLTPNTEQN